MSELGDLHTNLAREKLLLLVSCLKNTLKCLFFIIKIVNFQTVKLLHYMGIHFYFRGGGEGRWVRPFLKGI